MTGREVWVDVPLPGGYVCGEPDPYRPGRICGMPVESEPCPLDHRKPPVITLCGSTKFRPDFDRVNRELTLAGWVVITPGVWWIEEEFPEEEAAQIKERLDILHQRKIDMSDAVMVINLNGYIGDSTRAEIEYAIVSGKPVLYAYPPPAKPAVAVIEPGPSFRGLGGIKADGGWE